MLPVHPQQGRMSDILCGFNDKFRLTCSGDIWGWAGGGLLTGCCCIIYVRVDLFRRERCTFISQPGGLALCGENRHLPCVDQWPEGTPAMSSEQAGCP